MLATLLTRHLYSLLEFISMPPLDYFVHFWDRFIGRTGGPLAFRFLFQPLVAVIIAIRSGLRDYREGWPPYLLFPSFFDHSRRREMFRLLLQDVGKVFIVASILDIIYEAIAFRSIRPDHVLKTAFILAVIPYLLIRGLFARIILYLRSRKSSKISEKTT